jgi:hypothetical protein
VSGLNKKKPVTASGAGNGFFIFGMLCLHHYQPLVLIAANEAGDKNEPKDDNVDNGDSSLHKINIAVELSVTLTAGNRDVKRFSRSMRSLCSLCSSRFSRSFPRRI